MITSINRILKMLLLTATLLILSACAIPITGGNNTPLPAQGDTFTPIPSNTAAPTNADLQPTVTQLAALEPTRTVMPVNPTQNVDEDPYIIVLRTIEARVGPGLNYNPSHWLEAGTKSAVRGRSADQQWWVIAGAGDGPGPVSWISAADVQFYGDASRLDIYPLPSLKLPNVPVHADPGSPPANACVAIPDTSNPILVYIRLGPGEQFNVSYRLSGWAEIVKTEAGWHQVLLGPGEAGWVNSLEVQTSGLCE
jgi:hypothetical protein